MTSSPGSLGIAPPEADNIRAELLRVLASDEFRSSERRSRLLKFLVERALNGDTSHIKEYVVGVEVFDKPPDYDPRIDPAVRVEMSRVRTKLAEYYAGSGAASPLRIEFPKGSYAPNIQLNDAVQAPPAGNSEPAKIPHSRIRWGVAIALAACLAGVGVWRFALYRTRIKSDETAVQLCNKARVFWNKRTPETLRTSLELYQQAIRTAPRYAPAYAGVALCYAVMASNAVLPAAEFGQHAVEAAREALALDPNVAEAHAALGLVAYSIESDWNTADSELARALALDPNFASAHQWRALSLLYTGHADAAVQEIRRALEIDPVSMQLHTADAIVSYYRRDYDAVVEKARKMLDVDPSFREAHIVSGDGLEAKGDFAGAEREFNTVALASSGDSEGPARLAHLYAVSGRRRKAEDILHQLLSPPPDQYVDPYQIATIYAGLGRNPEALDWLQKAVRQRSAIIMKVDPYLDPLRGEPQFAQLLAQMHLN